MQKLTGNYHTVNQLTLVCTEGHYFAFVLERKQRETTHFQNQIL